MQNMLSSVSMKGYGSQRYQQEHAVGLKLCEFAEICRHVVVRKSNLPTSWVRGHLVHYTLDIIRGYNRTIMIFTSKSVDKGIFFFQI